MQIINTVAEMSAIVRGLKGRKRIGLVPTMGSLHKGHTSLFDEAKKQCDVVVASVFVNPTQFGPKEDYSCYPRNLENDTKLAKEYSVDYLFVPNVQEMYPNPNKVAEISIPYITDRFEGAFRPTHFAGVALVVAKLFNIVQPDIAVFGQKDYQQTLVIKQMVEALNFQIEIVIAPTIRLCGGLALSSRNAYLSEDEEDKALSLYRSMNAVEDAVKKGERSSKVLNSILHDILLPVSTKIDYAEIVKADDLTATEYFNNGDKAVILLAVYFGKTRLIDNKIIEF